MEIENKALDMQRSEPVTGGLQPGARPDVSQSRRRLMPALSVLGVAAWCITVMAIGVNLAESTLEWACVFSFGTAVPSFFLWQANHLLTLSSGPDPSAGDRHKELLKVLAERGEITPVSAALRTSLTLDEASGVLDELAMKNHLEVRAEDGVVVYALREWDRHELLATTKQSGPEREVRAVEQHN